MLAVLVGPKLLPGTHERPFQPQPDVEILAHETQVVAVEQTAATAIDGHMVTHNMRSQATLTTARALSGGIVLEE